MRILLVSSFSYPHVGGLSQYITLLRKGLESRGHYVEVLSLSSGWNMYRMHKRRAAVSRLTLERMIVQQNFRSYRQQTAGLPQRIRETELRRRGLELAARRLGVRGFDVIHAQDIVAAMAMAKLGLKKSKLVTTLHGSMAGEMLGAFRQAGNLGPRVWKYLYAIEHFGARASDRVIVPSSWLRNLNSSSFGTPIARIAVVPHGTDAKRFAPSVRRGRFTARSQSTPVILNTGRLERSKGHSYMLSALSRLKQHRWKAYIAGSGSQRRALERIRNQHGLQRRVAFLGARRDIPALLRQADIAVMPSLVETFGFSVVEAQLAGLPVVGFKTSGVSELIVHGKTGYLAPMGNTAKLVEHIRTLLNNPGLRQRMGKAARARAMNLWTLPRMINTTIQVYQAAPRGAHMVPADNLIAAVAGISTSNVQRRLHRIAIAYRK